MSHGTNPSLASTEQILDISRLIGRAFMKMPKDKATAILSSVARQKAFVKEICKFYDLKPQSDLVLLALPLLIDYYKKVFGLDIASDIESIDFPENNAFSAFMVASPKHDEDEIAQAITVYNKVSLYAYKNPIAANIDREKEQQRPLGMYAFAHVGGDEPDTRHLGKSYDDAMAIKMAFANPKEYLLMTGFHKFIKGYFMDKKGWTRTSSLWLDGRVVRGRWDESDAEIRVSGGHRGHRNSDGGPRELFLL